MPWKVDSKKYTWCNGQPQIRINFIYKRKNRGYIYRVGGEGDPWYWDHQLREFLHTNRMRPFPSEESIKNTVEHRIEVGWFKP